MQAPPTLAASCLQGQTAQRFNTVINLGTMSFNKYQPNSMKVFAPAASDFAFALHLGLNVLAHSNCEVAGRILALVIVTLVHHVVTLMQPADLAVGVWCFIISCLVQARAV